MFLISPKTYIGIGSCCVDAVDEIIIFVKEKLKDIEVTAADISGVTILKNLQPTKIIHSLHLRLPPSLSPFSVEQFGTGFSEADVI